MPFEPTWLEVILFAVAVTAVFAAVGENRAYCITKKALLGLQSDLFRERAGRLAEREQWRAHFARLSEVIDVITSVVDGDGGDRG